MLFTKRCFYAAVMALAFLLAGNTLYGQSFKEKLESIPQVKSVIELESSEFGEKYLCLFEQPIDHKDLSKGTFTQRIFVGHVDCDSATVIVTEGYAGNYAMRPAYRDEISRMFNTNNILVEHRYFAESSPYKGLEPSEIDWTYLNGENASNDLHNVTTAFKSLYNGKWISTGISKGGQNTMIYRTFFPDDVDLSVPYVGPLCRAAQDGRHESFIADFVGTPQERERVLNFQIEILKRKERLLPAFDSLCKANKLEFNLPVDHIYDYNLLEFSFAFWQWGYPVDQIPSCDASDKELFNYFISVCSPDYFVKWSATTPFFVQAAKELGYYGYDLKPFRKYRKLFSINNTRDYLHKIMLPQGKKFQFSTKLYHHISAFLLETDAKFIFIYGEFDPWTAVKPADPHKENMKFYIHPEGSHRARISSFDPFTQAQIKSEIADVLYN